MIPPVLSAMAIRRPHRRMRDKFMLKSELWLLTKLALHVDKKDKSRVAKHVENESNNGICRSEVLEGVSIRSVERTLLST